MKYAQIIGDVGLNPRPNLFINGEWVEPVRGRWISIINPTADEFIGDIPTATAEDVDLTVDVVKRALTGNRGKVWARASGAVHTIANFSSASINGDTQTKQGSSPNTSNINPQSEENQHTPADVELIKSDIVSFASTLGLGLAPFSAPNLGFGDSNFRKSGLINAPKPPKSTDEENSDARSQPCPKPHHLPPNPTQDPLTKATVLSDQWHANADDLEAKVLVAAPPLSPVAMQEREAVVAKKKEVAERLMEQYVLEYESSRQRSGDVRMLKTTVGDVRR